MADIRVYYDSIGNTLTVWFGEEQAEYICEEAGDEVILMKDEEGHVLGFEKLNVSLPSSTPLRIAFETIVA